MYHHVILLLSTDVWEEISVCYPGTESGDGV